jgi:NAD(P)H dehydrogenase (quinone)
VRARARGAHETAHADIRDQAALEHALSDCAGAFYFCPRAEPDEASIGRAFIEATERAGVPRIVFISAVQPEAPIPNHRAKLEVEGRLACSPLEHTILRPGMFMQTLPSRAEIGERDWIGRPFPIDALLTIIDVYDIAEAAAIALTEDHLINGTFELASQGMVTMAQIAEWLSEDLGKPIEARELSLDEWAADKSEAFASPYRRELFRAMWGHYAAYGCKGGNGFILSRILGREPSSFPEYLARRGRAPWAVPASA